MSFWTQLALTLLATLLLRPVLSLQPNPWLAWIAPLPLLYFAYAKPGHAARFAVFLAALFAGQVNAPYFLRVLPTPAVALVLVLQALQWLFVIGESSRLVKKSAAPWALFAYPIFWVAADTLMSAFLPDGNWASLAYTQAEFLPLMQTASLFGVAGVLFLLCLPASAIALAIAKPQSRRTLLPVALLIPLLAISWGAFRLRNSYACPVMSIGLAAVDDAIGLQARPAYIDRIRAAYSSQIAALTADGAKLVVLPEKIAVAPLAQQGHWNDYFAGLAASHHIWLLAGIAIDRQGMKSNEAWLFDPQGKRQSTFLKHKLAPPERGDYTKGSEIVISDAGALQVGLSICKDMHFASFARPYGELSPTAMLVPAWDFGLDAWLASRITATRAIENGFGLLRSSREGFLSANDSYGRVLAETISAPIPGARLFIPNYPARPLGPTLYTRIGDAFAWLCVAAALAMMIHSRRRSSP